MQSPTPSSTSSNGDSGLSRASSLLSQMRQVHELLWGLRKKLPLWTKPCWDLYGGGDENTEPSVAPSKVCRVPVYPEVRSRWAATPGVQGQVYWGPAPLWADWPWVGRRSPPSWVQSLQKLPGFLGITGLSAPWQILWAPGEPQSLRPKLPLLKFKEIKPVHPKGNQSWIFTGKTNAEAEAPVLWPPGSNRQLIENVPVAGKDWRQEKKGATEDEMVDGITNQQI